VFSWKLYITGIICKINITLYKLEVARKLFSRSRLLCKEIAVSMAGFKLKNVNHFTCSKKIVRSGMAAFV